MRALIAGAGALGTCYAVLLARAGASVTVLARQERLEALRGGLRISGLAEGSTAVRLATSGPEAGPVDYLILATKAADTPAVLEALRGGELECALSLQNGLAKDDALATAFGRERVIGAACAVGATLLEPGHARLTMNVATWLGELDGHSSARVARLAAALRAAGFPSWSVPDIRGVEWYKLCMLLPGALATALSRRSYAEMALDPHLSQLWVRILRETCRIALANDVTLVDPPGSPWRLAAWSALPDEAVLRDLHAIGEHQRAAGERLLPSMLQDILADRRTEAEDLAGDLLRRAAEKGVPAPALETCYRLVRGLENGF